jgi:leucyl-tRNA synthetase
MVIYDIKAVDKKWQDVWAKKGIFEPKMDSSKKKIFVTVPIPYPSGSMHLGHMYTWTRADIYARFMRMKGFNVLFPQGFHFTGGPIVGMAEKVKQRDPETIDAFKKQGVSEADLKKFADSPRALAEYFTESFKKDFESIGMSIDWRRTFITSSLNPQFSRFISWQFNKLRELGLITEGKHPVVWCPKENTPLGDHDRAEGEGESPQKFTIIKFMYREFTFPTATLRPETIFGATNIWVNQDGNYAVIKVGKKEKWIVSLDSIQRLENQLPDVKFLEKIDIKQFLGKTVKNPINGEEIPIFPEEFVDTNIGTGVVMSVPMHAPFDFYGLKKITDSDKKFNPKIVIDVPDQKEIVKEAIKRFGESETGLKEATKLVYKNEFNYGIMNKNAGELSGLSVKEAYSKTSDILKSKNAYNEMYELTGKVVCRCGSIGIVKVLEKQWFIRYSDKEWKNKTRRLIEKMNLYPEELRLQFLNILEWLDDKAAARKGGLGTPLPWDKEWIIEPLSDSTIYMAYYTIVNEISKLDLKDLTDEFFDYVFLGKGAPPKKNTEKIELLRKQFDYWYPVDMRVSAKELIQNHFTFFLMNHCAIFGEDKWPRGIAINGWLTVSGEKLAKSKGATLTIKRGLETYSTDQLRMVAAAGNGIDDVEWDPAVISGFDQRIGFIFNLIEMSKTLTGKNRLIDSYLISKINKITKAATENIETFRYGSALAQVLFEMYNEIKLYLELGGNNKETVNRFLSTFIRLNHPIFPHVTEELNERLGNSTLLECSEWPIVNQSEINELLENEVAVLIDTIEDIKNVIKLIKKTPSKITIGITKKERFNLHNKVVETSKKTKNIIEIRKILRTSDKLLDRLLKNPNKIPDRELDEKLEYDVILQAKEYLEKVFNSNILIEKESHEDKAMPGKPVIKIE